MLIKDHGPDFKLERQLFEKHFFQNKHRLFSLTMHSSIFGLALVGKKIRIHAERRKNFQAVLRHRVVGQQ